MMADGKEEDTVDVRSTGLAVVLEVSEGSLSPVC